MDISLSVAAGLAVFIGLAHSVLGERYILMRLFRRGDLPQLFGGQEFTRHTLRFAWHVTTVAWWCLAAILLVVASDRLSAQAVLYPISACFAVSAVIAAVGSRLRHLSWIVFALIAVLTAISARALS